LPNAFVAYRIPINIKVLAHFLYALLPSVNKLFSKHEDAMAKNSTMMATLPTNR
jgi:hypothetical protein